MTRTNSLWLASGFLACLIAGRAAADEIKLDDFKSKTPEAWKSQKPSSNMRLAQFLIPRAKGDEADGELVIFKGFGGSAKQNVERWKGQFIPPEGKTFDDKDVAKLEETKVAGCTVTILDISGTYLDGPPMLPREKKMKKPNYRMFAVQFEAPDNNYHILMRGPAKTMAEQKEGFDKWIKGFAK